MGRGQLFAYGHNVWRSNTFRMEVNVERDELNYNLTCDMPEEPGCVVEVMFYTPLSAEQLHAVAEEIRHQIYYVRTPVYLNGARINTDPSTLKWTHETAEADILVNRMLRHWEIYNQGVLAVTLPNSKLPGGGIVVSKVPVQLNFARNELMETCPVWRRLQQVLVRVGTSRRRRPQSAAQRVAALVAAMSNTSAGYAWLYERIIPGCGTSRYGTRWYSIAEMLSRGQLVEAPDDLDWKATRALAWLHQQRLVFCYRPRYTGEEAPSLASVIAWLRNQALSRAPRVLERAQHVRILNVQQALALKPAVGLPVADDKIKGPALLALAVLRQVVPSYVSPARTIGAFTEPDSAARHAVTTDGSSFVAINTDVLQRLRRLSQWFKLCCQIIEATRSARPLSIQCHDTRKTLAAGGPYSYREHDNDQLIEDFQRIWQMAMTCARRFAHSVSRHPERITVTQRRRLISTGQDIDRMIEDTIRIGEYFDSPEQQQAINTPIDLGNEPKEKHGKRTTAKTLRRRRRVQSADTAAGQATQ
jgi:hypothetical protein